MGRSPAVSAGSALVLSGPAATLEVSAPPHLATHESPPAAPVESVVGQRRRVVARVAGRAPLAPGWPRR
jgi:hypothetical protein